jgi:hypothetical protein
MATRRKSLRLQKDEDQALRELYREFRIPTDQYPHRPDDLERLAAAWNSITGRNEAALDILHYMITQRKQTKWERLGWNSGDDFKQQEVAFTADDFKHLDAIHEDLHIASDNYVLNIEASKRLQEEFARRTGRVIPPLRLAAAMITRRKAHKLATLRPQTEQNLGFHDIDEVAQ